MSVEQMQAEITRLQGEKAILEGKAQNRQQYPVTAQRERFAWEATQLGNRIGQLEYNIRREYELNSPMAQMAAQIANQLKQQEQAKAADDEAQRQERIKASAKAAFLRDGGAPENFELVWPGIQANLAAEAATAAARQAMVTEQSGGDVRQVVQNMLREKYTLPRGDEFLQPVFQGAAAGFGKFNDAFDGLANAFPPDDIPVDVELA